MPAQPVDATPSDTNLLLKGGVYDASETREAFCGAEGRAVGPLEIGTVVERDWAGPRQGPCGHSLFVGPSWWDCSGHPSALSAITDPGGARGHLPRDCLRFVDS